MHSCVLKRQVADCSRGIKFQEVGRVPVLALLSSGPRPETYMWYALDTYLYRTVGLGQQMNPEKPENQAGTEGALI